MKCPSCDSENFDGAKFCSLCFWPLGGAVDPPAVSAPETYPQSVEPAPEYPQSVEPAPETYAQSVETAASQATPMSSGPASAPAVYDSVDAGKFVDGMFVAERLAAAESPKHRGWNMPVFKGISFGMIRLVLSVLALVIGISAWMMSGGYRSMKEGEIARIPVPANSSLVATQREITKGPLGPLAEERQVVYATRVFVAPYDENTVIAYYGSGAGSAALLKEGWTGGVRPGRTWGSQLGKWNRTKSLGYRSEEKQELVVEVTDYDPSLPENIQAQLRSGAYSAIRITCTGAGLQKLEYPQR